MATESTLLADLATADLTALRLAAQVMRHKAELDSRPVVADYFDRLANASAAELGRRGEAFRVITEADDVRLGADAQPEDRRLLAEYLGLLIGNERLSRGLRDVSRTLRSRDCR